MYNIFNHLRTQNIIQKIIYINVLIFIIFNLLNVISYILNINIGLVITDLYLTANKIELLKKPWTLITYLFIHYDILHLFTNMLFLYLIGKIFLQYLNSKQAFYIYILGGISGGLLFITAYNYIPIFNINMQNVKAIGASASVLAIIFAISTYKPNYKIHLPFIGLIKLKYIALTCLLIDLISIPNGNAGGHIAHIGGALFGWIYIKALQKEKKYLSFNYLNKIKKIFIIRKNNKTKFKRTINDYEYNKQKIEKQKEINLILEKISKSGYESLTKNEKKILFNESKNK